MNAVVKLVFAKKSYRATVKSYVGICLITLACFSWQISPVLSQDKTTGSENTVSQKVFPVKDNPGSIISGLDKAEEERAYLFQLPGMAGPMQSWTDWKASLNEKYGLRFLVEWAALYQKASNTLGTEDDAAGYDLEFNGTWTFLGRNTPTYSMLGFGAFKKATINTDLSEPDSKVHETWQ